MYALFPLNFLHFFWDIVAIVTIAWLEINSIIMTQTVYLKKVLHGVSDSELRIQFKHLFNLGNSSDQFKHLFNLGSSSDQIAEMDFG